MSRADKKLTERRLDSTGRGDIFSEQRGKRETAVTKKSKTKTPDKTKDTPVLRDEQGRTLLDILQSTSDVLFPGDMGTRTIVVDTRDCEGDTALHVIVRRKDLAGAELLLRAGANPNAIGDMGETPLHVAIHGGAEEIVSALMRHGAQPDVLTEFGETAREIANKEGGRIARLVAKRSA